MVVLADLNGGYILQRIVVVSIKQALLKRMVLSSIHLENQNICIK